MKKLSLIDKLLVVVNSIVAAISLVAFLSYFISPNTIPLVSFIGLSIPFLLILNILFIIYWVIRLKKQFLIYWARTLILAGQSDKF